MLPNYVALQRKSGQDPFLLPGYRVCCLFVAFLLFQHGDGTERKGELRFVDVVLVSARTYKVGI